MTSTRSMFLEARALTIGRDAKGELFACFGERSIPLGEVTFAFPLSDRDHFLILRDREGRQIGIVEEAHEMDEASRSTLTSVLERSYFLPRIDDVLAVTDRLDLHVFHVHTDKGLRTFEVRNPRQSIRAVGHDRYVLRDVDGNRYEIPRLSHLGPRAQSLMKEFV